MADLTNGSLLGIWGIASAETAVGLIIEQIEETSRSEKSYIRNESGERGGRTEYDESVEVSISGENLSSAQWSQKLGAELTFTNTLSLAYLNAVGPGETLVDEVKRTRNREDWEKITVECEVLPFF